MNDEPFTRNDIIVLQDPRNMTKFNLSNYHHVKFKLKAVDEEEGDSTARLKKVNHETRDTMYDMESQGPVNYLLLDTEILRY